MIPKPNLLLAAIFTSTVLLGGCVTESRRAVEHGAGESVVFVGEEPAALAHCPLRGKVVSVRNTYLREPGTLEYVEGRDFTIDRTEGVLRRTPHSRIPDFRGNPLFGQDDFDHSRFPGFGNNGFFAFVDYSFVPAAAWPIQPLQTDYLSATRAKLEAGASVKIIAFGDSITAGMDVPNPSRVFWNRWAEELQRKHLASHITIQNGATSGDSTVQGLQRLQTKVLDEHPDLVLVGFGMNDHNRGGVPVPQFEENLLQIIARIRKDTAAEVILFSAFPPNPKWKFGSQRMAEYAAATERAARTAGCAYADVFDNWQALAARKKPEDLLANNINHPNEFGHWIYYRVFSALGL